MFLIRRHSLRPANIKSVPAVSTIDHTCKRTYSTTFLPSLFMTANLLNQIKVVLRNNWLVGVFNDKSVLLWIFIQLLVFVGLAVSLEVDRVIDVFHTFKNMHDRCHSPTLCFSVLIAYIHSFGTVIRCWRRHTVRCQDIGDLCRTVTLNAELKYSFHYGGSFIIN